MSLKKDNNTYDLNVINLGVISLIGENKDKLDYDSVTKTFKICHDSIYSRFYRYLNEEDRNKTYDALHKLYDEAFENIKIIKESSSSNSTNINETRPIDKLIKILGALENSLTGLNNLINTYKGDECITTKLTKLHCSVLQRLQYARELLEIKR